VTTEPDPRRTVAQNEWGRVDDQGDVFVRAGDVERKIGSWQVGEPERALAFFGRKYDDLAVQVGLLEQRLGSGAAAPDETQSGVRKLREALVEPHAIGDFDSLARRLDAIDDQVAQRRAERRAQRAQALEDARDRKEREAASQIAAQLSGRTVTITARAGEGGRLFGSVTTTDIADLLAKQGLETDRRKIELAEPIKSLGDFTATVKLHQNVNVPVQVRVVPA